MTLFVGLRLQSRTFLFTAFAVQLLGGALFLLRLQGAGEDSAAVFSAGWSGLLSASLIGLALIAGMLLAARDEMVRGDVRLLRGLSVVLLAGLVLINLAVLFVLPWQTASAVWAASGLLIIWLSLYLKQRVSFVFGLLLQVIGGAAFLLAGPELLGPLSSEGLKPLAHGGFWTPLVLGLAAMIGAWRLQLGNHASAFDALSLQRLSEVLLVWGAGWWALAWVSEVLRFAPPNLQGTLLLLVAAMSVALWTVLSLRLKWPALGLLCTLLIPAAGLVLLAAWHSRYHPAADFGWLAWAAVFAVHFFSLRRLAPMLPARALSTAHVLGCWLLIGVLALELRYGLLLLSEQYNAWRWLGWAILPSLYLLLAAAPRNWPWPVAAYCPRIPLVRRRAVGGADARVVLAGEWRQRWQRRTVAVRAAAQPVGVGSAVRVVRRLCLVAQCGFATGDPQGLRRIRHAIDRRGFAVRLLHRVGHPRRAPLGRGSVRAGYAARLDAGAGRACPSSGR